MIHPLNIVKSSKRSFQNLNAASVNLRLFFLHTILRDYFKNSKIDLYVLGVYVPDQTVLKRIYFGKKFYITRRRIWIKMY